MASITQFDKQRIPFLFYIFFPIFSACAAFGFISALPDNTELWDFGLLFLCGLQASLDLNPYGSSLMLEVAKRFHITFTFPNLNSPFSIIIYEALLPSDPVQAFYLWWILSIFIFVVCLFVLLQWLKPENPLFIVFWSFSLAPLWMTLALGQVYTFILLFVILTYLSLDKKRWVLAGLLIGTIVALKPNFILWPILLLVADYRKSAIVAFLVAGIFSLLPVIFHGFTIYYQWFATMDTLASYQIATGVSISSLIGQLSPNKPLLKVLFSVIAVIFVLSMVRKKKPSPVIVTDIAILTTLAISPISWLGYTLFLLPAYISRITNKLSITSACLLCVPGNLVFHYSFIPIIWGHMLSFIYPTAIVLLGARIVLDINRITPQEIRLLRQEPNKG